MSKIYLGAFVCARGVFLPGPDVEAALSPEEALRAGSFGSPAARLRFLAGRWLARTMLGRLLDLPAAAIPISVAPGGRPTLAHGGPWYFSIAHSGDLAVCAVADLPVGVDLERVTADRDPLGIARACFQPAEIEDVAAEFSRAGPMAAAVRFAAYWTLKEAHLKRRGGSVWDMRQAPVFPLGTAAAADATAEATAWCCLEIPPRVSLPSPYVLGVSVEGVAGTGSLSCLEVRREFLLAEDPMPRLLFRSGSAGQPGARG